MPLPLAVALPLIGAAVNTASNVYNTASTAANNRKGRAFAREMYARQRADALADWNMQNQYNSPEAQMERLRAAGLNPNLVYDNGATYNASAVCSSNAPSWNPDAPQLNLSSVVNSLQSYFDIKLKQAQTDNLNAAKEVAVQDAVYRAAQTAATVAGTEQTKVSTKQGEFNLQMAENLKQVTLEKASAELAKTRADTQFVLDNNERQAALTAQTLKKGVEEIMSIRSARAKTEAERNKINVEIDNIRKDGTLKQLDINLKKMGVQPGDPAYMRIISQIVNNPDGALQGVKNVFDNFKSSVIGGILGDREAVENVLKYAPNLPF